MLTGWLMLVIVVVIVSVMSVPASVTTALRTVCWPSIQTVNVAIGEAGVRHRLLHLRLGRRPRGK